ncbi:MAG: NepR family anti-sigma factor [Pseudomonadota bacterium]
MKNTKNSDPSRNIDENLKRVYEQTLDEGIPDRFLDLLTQLKQQEQGGGNK